MTWKISATHAVRMFCENPSCSFLKKLGRQWIYKQVILRTSDVPTQCVHCDSRNIRMENIGDGKTLTPIC